MRSLTIILLVFSTVTGAQVNKNHDLKIEVLNDLLQEGHITQLAHNNKVANLQLTQLRARTSGTDKPIVHDLKAGPSGTASISGNVNVAGSAVDGMWLSLFEYPQNFVGSAVTDSSGDYTFSDLAAGSYYVVAENYFDEYINVIWSAVVGTETCVNACIGGADNEITLADETNFVGIDLSLTVGGSIAGNVSSGGSPVADSFIVVRETGNTYQVSALTDASGNYLVTGLSDGNYHVFANDWNDDFIDAVWSISGTDPCNNCQTGADNDVAVVAAANVAGIDLTLTVGATLTGQITDSITSAPIETLGVRLYDINDENFNGFFFSQFDGMGNYTLRGVPEGDYKVYLDPDLSTTNQYIPEIYNGIQCNLCGLQIFNGAGDVVTLTNGSVTAGINFSLEVGASISGFILNGEVTPAAPMAERALVYIFDASNRVIGLQFFSGTNYDSAYDGSYTVGGLLPGTYFAQGGDLGAEFFQRELYNNLPCPWSGCDRGAGGVPIVLGAGEQRTGIDFILAYGGKISGTVVDAVTLLPIESDQTQYIQFYDSSGEIAGGSEIRADGTYLSRRGLPPGTYSVRTGTMFQGVFNAPYVMQKYMPGGNIDCPGVTCDLSAGNVVVSALGTVTGIDFQLSTGNSFSGTITELNPPNATIPDVHVLVYDSMGEFATWATTDALGNFTVSGLPDGTYYALTNNGSNLPFIGIRSVEVGTWVDILFDGNPCPGSACNVLTGDPIVLPAPPTIEGVGGDSLNFTMSTGGSITGQINTFGQQIPGSYVNVQVYDNNLTFYGTYQADEAGAYLTAGLPDGAYYLKTQSDGALVDVLYGDAYCFNDACDVLNAIPVLIENGESLPEVNFELRTDYVFKNGLD